MQKNRATHKPIANVPTPLWKDAKERVLREMVNVQTQLSHKNAHLDDDDEASSAGLVGTSVSGNNLGTIVKSDIFRPREMISMGALKEQDLFDGTLPPSLLTLLSPCIITPNPPIPRTHDVCVITITPNPPILWYLQSMETAYRPLSRRLSRADYGA